MPKEANEVDSPQSQHQEITVEHGSPLSNDELLKIIQGANGMPVLFIPSGNGRLAAVAVDGLQNLVPTNPTGDQSAKKERLQDFRAWLLFLTSLVATMSYTAGLTPPGGFWSADDKEKGYSAGASVMRDKFPPRYLAFCYSNAIAFFSSLIIIVMLAGNINKEFVRFYNQIFKMLVALCLMSVVASFVSGTWESMLQAYMYVLLLAIIFVMLVALCVRERHKHQQDD